MIEGLIQGLSKELNLSAEEIADTVWLALQITSDFPDSPIPQDEPPTTPLEIDDLPQSILNQNEDFPRIPLNEQDSPESPSPQEELSEPPINPLPEEQKAEICPRDEQDSSKNSGLSLKIPDASSLREPLTLARALKPLMRRVASGQGWVLDEVATTQQIAEKNIWIPILKPTLEPWLDLDLVVDESISMHIWRSTINELEKLLKNYGIFRDVRIWGLLGDDPEKIQIRRGIGATAKNQSPRSPKELIDPSGRRLVLVVSDCVSSLWRSGKFTPVLELWAKQGLMAIVQMLPKWMWETTALAWASEVRLRGLHPGAFNQNLIAEYLSFWDEVDEKRGVKVPVFTLEPEPALNWAQVLAGKGNVSVAGYVFDLDRVPVEQERRLLNFGGDSSAESRVQGFRVTASPMARRLAGLLASAPVITLPIVRLIQETLLKESRQVNVAEVFLGGLLEPLSEIKAETNPDYVKYDFIEGVRELFLESVPSDYALTVIDEVSKYVAKKLDFSVEYFGAILRNPRQVEDGEIADNMKAFATVTAEVLRGLGGPYVAFAESIENEITANDNQVLEGLGEPDVDVAESIENEIIANDNQVWEGLEEPDVDVAESSENEIIANDNESSNELKQLIKQPDSTKLLFLPPLQQNAGVGTNRPGQWQHRNDVTLDRIAQSLALPKGKDAGNGCSIPDMWARPLWVDIVLTGNASHPLRSDFKAQWKGMLAAIALAKVQGFNLRAQFLDLGRSSQDKFISSLLQLIPPKEKSIYLLDQGKINPWKHIFLFLWNDRPVGMTSPSTLICPSADGDWTGLHWWSQGQLRSPIDPEDWLTTDEKTQLWLWLNNLKSQLEACQGNYAGKIKEIVAEFQEELAQALGATPATATGPRLARIPRHFGVEIVGGPLAALNTPIEALPRPSSIQLMPRINIGQKVLFIIPDSQTLLDQWTAQRPKDIWIYDSSLVNFNLEEFKKKYNREKEDYLYVSEIFSDKFYFIEGGNQLPGGLMPKGYEEVAYSDVEGKEHHLTPLLPINPKLLNYFTPEELIGKIELKPAIIGEESGVRVSLDLPLSGGDYLIHRDYIIAEEQALNAPPVLEVWPNFQAAGWQEYYAFYYFTKLGETQKTFRVQFPNLEAAHPPILKEFQLNRLTGFPGFLTCQDEENPSLTLGLILLKTPPVVGDGDPNKTWTVGVDFGTSFTNVYYSINNTARPLSLSALNLQVTATSGATRSVLLYDYFFWPAPQEFPLATVLTTQGTKGGQERIFDGRIYIPESENLEGFDPCNDDIKTNLNWEQNNFHDNQRFLEHLALYIAAEAAINQVRRLEWTISYPSSFSPRDNNLYRAYWQRIIQDLPAKTGLQSVPLDPRRGNYYRSESNAFAHYFEAQEGKDLLYTTCINMGGGASDISIWLGRRLIHQCSVLLAGNLLFSQFIKQKPQFFQQQFGIDIVKLAGGTKEAAFYAKLNAVLSGKGEMWLRNQRSFMDDDPDLQYILQRTAIGISGLYYYVGLILKSLEIKGTYNRQQNTPVYIGGNASHIFKWLAPSGMFDSQFEVYRLFSRMLSKGSGFADTQEPTVLSSRPKAEVACGLVLDQRQTRLIGLDDDNEDLFPGEDCYVNGTFQSWADPLKLPENVQTFEIRELPNLTSFLDEFHQALTDLRIRSIKPLAEYKDESKQERLWRDTNRRLESELLNMTGNIDNIRKEPPFILALKALLSSIK